MNHSRWRGAHEKGHWKFVSFSVLCIIPVWVMVGLEVLFGVYSDAGGGIVGI